MINSLEASLNSKKRFRKHYYALEKRVEKGIKRCVKKGDRSYTTTILSTYTLGFSIFQPPSKEFVKALADELVLELESEGYQTYLFEDKFDIYGKTLFVKISW